MRAAAAVLARSFGLVTVLGAAAALAPAVMPAATSLEAQAVGRVTGTVTDTVSGRPLSAVQISIAGTRLGGLTDEAGRFTVNNVPVGPVTVEGRRLGYQPVSRRAEVTGGGVVTVALTMRIAALNLQAVVTTGVVDPTSGTRVPFTVGRVSSENAPVPAANAVETIQGKVAGVTVVPSGQPGSGTNVILRSPTSISKSNSPLIVVDGVVLSQSFDGSTADLESMDIESVEIVKGAAAASLYGSRASAGVINIRTKRGGDQADGATRVTGRAEYGSNALGNKVRWARNHPFLINPAGQYVNAAGAVVTRAQRVPKPAYALFQDGAYIDPVFDQVDRFFDPGNFQKNSINVAQNAGKSNWFLSYVNSREDGVVLNAGGYEQNDLRINLDHRPRESLRLSFSGYHSRSARQNIYGDTFFDLINQAPDVDLRVPDPDGTPYRFQGDPTEAREENPLYVLATEDRRRLRARTQGSFEARLAPRDWLSFDGNVSYDRSDRRTAFFLDRGVKTEGASTDSGGVGEIRQTLGSTDAFNGAVSANVLQRFGGLTLRATARGLMEREDNVVTDSRGTNLAVPGVRSLENATQRFFPDATDEAIRTNSFIVSTGAEYDGRYILDGLVRRDGSSLFGPEERWNTYYRVSGSWRMGEESWFPFKNLFTEFKPRASRGTAGGRPDYEDQYETLAFLEGGGLQKQTLGNRFLKPELATETELGLDMIVKDRYSLQLSYARSRVQDQLINVPLGAAFGYPSQWRNAGTVEGNTIEGTFEAQVIRRPTLTWRLGVVADRSRNRITEFDGTCFSRNTVAFVCAGETLGAMYGFQFINSTAQLPADAQARAGEFARNDDGILVYVGPGNTFRDGETKRLWGTSSTIGTSVYGWGNPIVLRDATGNSAVTRIGDGNPDFHFGVSNNVQWRALQLFALVDANVGGQVYNQTNQRMYQYGRSADVDQAGKAQELKKPTSYYAALYAANDPTSYFVEDAGFVKLREVSLRYRLGQRLIAPLARLGARQVGLSLIGRNLLTFSDYKGYDPEIAVNGGLTRLDSFAYPRYRTFTGSLDVQF